MRSEVKCQERQGSPGTSLASLDSPPEVVMRKMLVLSKRSLLINTAGPFTQILQPSWVDMNIREGRPAIAVSGGVGSPEDSWIPWSCCLSARAQTRKSVSTTCKAYPVGMVGPDLKELISLVPPPMHCG